ncbi:DUF5688 family protein [Lacrimispora sp.]|uniref:DUF5688 family protein n=1 Tax=Lacrimispora sp. TaxID=2719234 RepID=UPI0028AAB28C|nr:DUF5688 family protein [Lacrimispora sp.]
MVYETFLETVKQSMKERLGPDFTLILQPITKNNGLILHGLCIGKEDERAAPTIYLNHFYESYQKGRPLNAILDDIMALYQSSPLPDDLPIEEFLSQEQIMEKVIFRLINEPANRELLKEVPHINYPQLDLSIIFYISFQKDEDSLLTALIHNRHQKAWNRTTEELSMAARTNTPRLFPARIRSLPEAIKDIVKKSTEHEINEDTLEEFFDASPLSPPMYVLSNSSGINGAGCLLYEGILKDFASCSGSDLIILPSSIHEVLIIPYSKDISFDELAETVFSINQEEVPEEDRLSNHIYFYSKSSGKLTIAFTSSAPIGTKNP